VTYGDVGFLDALRIAGRHVQQKVNLKRKVPAGFAGHGDQKGSTAPSGFQSL
jgi:hypothetical protein